MFAAEDLVGPDVDDDVVVTELGRVDLRRRLEGASSGVERRQMFEPARRRHSADRNPSPKRADDEVDGHDVSAQQCPRNVGGAVVGRTQAPLIELMAGQSRVRHARHHILGQQVLEHLVPQPADRDELVCRAIGHRVTLASPPASIPARD